MGLNPDYLLKYFLLYHDGNVFYPIVILVPSYHPQVLYDLAPTEWPTSITFQSPRRGMKEKFL